VASKVEGKLDSAQGDRPAKKSRRGAARATGGAPAQAPAKEGPRERPRRRLASGSPARLSAYAAAVIGVGLAGYGVHVMTAGAPLPYAIALQIVGLTQIALSWLVLARNRIAWSFAVSLTGTIAVVLLFAGPKLRDMFEIPLAAALIPSLVFAALCTGFAVAGAEFGAEE
jgi:hypothetical protein